MRSKKKAASEILPTRSEMEVLQVLWKYGPSTVRTVHDRLSETKGIVQYTTTLKLMQIMTEKGMLLRDDSSMKHVFRPALEEKRTKGSLLDKFMERVYDGSVKGLMMSLLGNDKMSPKEHKLIREMMKKLDETK